jgi:hypothetical protein
MADHRRAKCLEGFLADLDRTWNVQFNVRHRARIFANAALNASAG